MDANEEYDTSTFRLGYTSLVTPDSIYDCDLATGELTLRKQQAGAAGRVRPGVRPRRLRAAPRVGHRRRTAPGCRCRSWLARARRATARRRWSCTATARTRSSIDPYFSIARLSLIDRGVVFAIAHIRGGGEMGRPWYDDGKLLAKKNTFTDFVACARARSSRPAGRSADRLVARGGSAGGLLVGAVANIAPDAFGGDRGRGAVRRRADDDPRPVAAADRLRVGRMGQPARTIPTCTRT